MAEEAPEPALTDATLPDRDAAVDLAALEPAAVQGSVSVEARPTREPPTHRAGFVDSAGVHEIGGWAADPASDGAVTVSVSIDGIVVAVLPCAGERPDVLAAGYPSARVGFTFAIPARYHDGNVHRIGVRFLDDTPLPFASVAEQPAEWAFSFIEVPELDGWIDRVEGDVVSGWTLQRTRPGEPLTGGVGVAIYCDGELAGEVKASDYRPDVGAALDADPACGFHFQIPHRFLGVPRRVTAATVPHGWILNGGPVTLARAPGMPMVRLRELQAQLDQISVQAWRIQNELRAITAPSAIELKSYATWADGYLPALRRRAPAIPADRSSTLVSVLCPVYRPRLKDFVTAVRSVIDQTYPCWELIIVDDRSDTPELDGVLDAFCREDGRIRLIRHETNQGIAQATNTAIAAASGDYIAFFDHDDVLVDVALQYMLDAALTTGASLLYSDEDKIDDVGFLSEPNFKPDWNLRLLLAQNYVCHLLFVKRDLVQRTGFLKAVYDGAQDHDFILRLSEGVEPDGIAHVREVLYHWRKTPNSTAATVSNKTYAIDAGVLAVQHYLDRQGVPATVRSRGAMTNYIVDWRLAQEPSVSVIIPFKDRVDDTRRCLDSLVESVAYRNYEVVLVDNHSLRTETREFIADAMNRPRVRVVPIEEAFNYSRINNLAARTCRSDLLLFLNNDVFVSDADWLTQMVGELSWRPDVGAVGAKLLYPSGRVQHAGVILGVGDGRVAEHPFRGLAAHDPGFMGRALCSQEFSAVTAAALLCRRAVFEEVGGFDETTLPVAFNDIDLCLKIGATGRRILWRAEATAVHAESASRSSDMTDTRLARFVGEHIAMKERWGPRLANDPHYHPLFDRGHGIFSALVG